MEIMQYVHPVIGGFAVLVGLIALVLGLQSCCSTLKGGPKKFKWKQHVQLGKISLVLLPFVVILGVYVATELWADRSFAEFHATKGYAMLILGMIGLGTGMFLTRKTCFKYKWRKKIVRLHGLVNGIAMLLGIYLAFSGLELFEYIY